MVEYPETGSGIADAASIELVAPRCARHWADAAPPAYGQRVAEDVTVPPFEGFPAAAAEFYQQLTVTNTKEFWNAQREVYETAIRGPMLALTHELSGEFGQFKVFRPHRDVRFSSDKSPYKTSQGAVTEGDGGEFYYVQVNADGLFVASGYYQMATDQLARFRAAVDGEATGNDLVARVAVLERKYTISGRALSTAPRGYPRDHPRIRFLQHKGLTAGRDFGTPDWLSTRQAKRRITETWRGAAALNEWLNSYVGPSQLAPAEIR